MEGEVAVDVDVVEVAVVDDVVEAADALTRRSKSSRRALGSA